MQNNSAADSAWSALLGDEEDEILNVTSTVKLKAADFLLLGIKDKDKNIPVVQSNSKLNVKSQPENNDDSFFAEMEKLSETTRAPLKLPGNTSKSSGQLSNLSGTLEDLNTSSLPFAEHGRGDTQKNLKEAILKQTKTIEPQKSKQQSTETKAAKPVIAKKVVVKKGETKVDNDQLDELQSFLNDDNDASDIGNSQYVFGSFLSPLATQVQQQHNLKPSSSKQPEPLPKTRRPLQPMEKKDSKFTPVQISEISAPTELEFRGYNPADAAFVKEWIEKISLNSASLRALDISSNNFNERLPVNLLECLNDLKSLQKLDLSCNSIAFLPRLSCPSLKILDLSLNRLTDLYFMDSFAFDALECLILFKNQIHVFSYMKGFFPFKSLKVLDLSSNKLEKIPECLFQIESLEELNLKSNSLVSLYEHDFSKLSNLKKMILSNNAIESLSKSVKFSPKLEELDLGQNLLTQFPFTMPTTLKRLNIRDNLISLVPGSIGKLLRLEYLDIRGNEGVNNLPSELGYLDSLETFLFDKASITFPSSEILSKPLKELQLYFKEVLRGSADADLSLVYGTGLSKKCVASETEQFFIKAVNKSGKQKISGDDKFEVEVWRSKDEEINEDRRIGSKIEDLKNGIYLVTYDAKKSGNYQIYVRINGGDLKSSPFSTTIEPAKLAPIKTRFVYEEGNDSKCLYAFAGQEQQFTLKTIDCYGNPMNTGGHIIKCQLTGDGSKEGFKFRFIDLKNGCYQIYFMHNTAGNFTLAISIDGEDVGSSVPILVKPGKVSPQNCKLSATGTNVAEINVKTSFVIQSFDSFNNKRTVDLDEFEAVIISSDGSSLNTEITANLEAGEYYVAYVISTAGRYRIEVKVKSDGKWLYIAGSPFELLVSHSQDARLIQLQNENSRLTSALTEMSRKYSSLAGTTSNRVSSADNRDESPEKYQKAFKFSCEDGKEIELIRFLTNEFGTELSFASPIAAYFAFEVVQQRLETSQRIKAKMLVDEFLKQMEDKSNSKPENDSENYICWFSSCLYFFNRLSCLKLQGADSEVLRIHDFETVCISLYRAAIKVIQNQLSPVIVNAFLDPPMASQSRGYFQSLKRRGSGGLRFKSALESVLSVLSFTFLHCQKYCIEQSIIEQLFIQIYRFIDAILLNSLLLRKNICDQENAQKIRANLQPLEDWVQDNELDLKSPVKHIRSATDLLRLPLDKMDISDSHIVVKQCPDLNQHQIEKLLRNSSEKISNEFIIAIVEDAKKREDGRANAASNQSRGLVFLDTFYVENLTLPEPRVEPVFVPKNLKVPFLIK